MEGAVALRCFRFLIKKLVQKIQAVMKSYKNTTFKEFLRQKCYIMDFWATTIRNLFEQAFRRNFLKENKRLLRH